MLEHAARPVPAEVVDADDREAGAVDLDMHAVVAEDGERRQTAERLGHRLRPGVEVVVAERHENAVARAEPGERREGKPAGLGPVDEVARDAHEIGLEGVHPPHVRGQFGDVQVLADVQVRDVHDAQPRERFGQAADRDFDARDGVNRQRNVHIVMSGLRVVHALAVDEDQRLSEGAAAN